MNENEIREQEIMRLRCDSVECHKDHDVMQSLCEAINLIPACGMLAILSAAVQEIRYWREKAAE